MWLWQRKDVSPEHLLVKRLLTLSTCVHAVLLIVIFFVYQGPGNTYDKTIAALVDVDATIVFLPGYKSLYHEVQGSGKRGASYPRSEQDEGTMVQASAEKSDQPTTTLISSPNTTVKKKSAQKQHQKKSPQKKKKEQKKITAKKKSAPKKSSQKKTLDKKNERVIKKRNEKKEKTIETRKEIESVVTTPQEVDPAVHNVSLGNGELEGSEHIIYVGQQEYDIMQVQEEIQKEAARVWSAPRGLSQSLTCLIMVRVGRDGTTDHVSIEESSGMLMYDIQARQAAHAMKFPQSAWGKEITVYFKN